MRHWCHDCEEFVEPIRHSESDPYGTGDGWYTVTYYVCPSCRLEEIEELVPCNTCGDRLPVDGYDDCIECIVKNEDGNYEEEDIAAAKRDVENKRMVGRTRPTGSTEEGSTR